jgi:hypothetical protein
VFMLPKDCLHDGTWKEDPVLLRASLKASSFAAPPKHTDCHESALAAAEGKLFLLGGDYPYRGHFADDSHIDPSRLEVFDPHTGMWYTASSPLP